MQRFPGPRAFWLLLVAAVTATACARKPASLEVSPRKLVLFGIVHPKEISVRVLDRKGREMADQPLTWSSSDPMVVEGSGTGHVSARKPGRANLTVSTGNVSSTIPVDVVDISEIVVVPPSLKLFGPPGTAGKLEVTAKSGSGAPVDVPVVVWSAENPKIVKVSGDGIVTSLSPGTTMVLVKVGDLISEAEVQVRNKTISRLELRPETAILKVTETQKFTAIAYDENGLLIPEAGAQFTSLNPELVKISGDGRATALAKGTAAVSAVLGGRVAQATVLIN